MRAMRLLTLVVQRAYLKSLITRILNLLRDNYRFSNFTLPTLARCLLFVGDDEAACTLWNMGRTGQTIILWMAEFGAICVVLASKLLVQGMLVFLVLMWISAILTKKSTTKVPHPRVQATKIFF